MLILDASCGNKPSSSFNNVSLVMVALGRSWTHSKRGWSGLDEGKTDDGRRSFSGNVYCAEEGDRKGSLIYSVCCIHGEPLGFDTVHRGGWYIMGECYN